MNEQTRIRLGLITERYERRLRQAGGSDGGWLAAFEEVCRTVLQTAMTEIGAELVRTGHSCHIDVGYVDEMPSLDWTLEPCAAPDSRRMVRFFARRDEHKGWEVLVEVWLSGTPCEVTRFRNPSDLTAEVAEKLLVDVVEQVFAAAGSNSVYRAHAPANAIARSAGAVVDCRGSAVRSET